MDIWYYLICMLLIKRNIIESSFEEITVLRLMLQQKLNRIAENPRVDINVIFPILKESSVENLHDPSGQPE